MRPRFSRRFDDMTNYARQLSFRNLRAELARRGMTQLDLAHLLGHPVSTLSSWLRSAAPMPPDLARRIEAALDLAPGSLYPEEE